MDRKDELQMEDAEMFRLVMDEIRAIRRRLDEHIDDENGQFKELQKDLSRINSRLENHNTKLAGMSAMISMVVAGVVTWLTTQWK